MTEYLSRKIKIVSFIAIVLVLVQHAINFTGYIDPNSSFVGKATVNTIIQYVIGYGFARIAVALFFLLSGYLFFRNFTLSKTISKLWSRVRSLGIPYLAWSALGLGFVFILQSIPGLTEYFSSLYTGRVIGQSFSYYVQSILHHGVTFPLWFLVDLMLYTLIAPLFYVILKSAPLLFLLPLWVLWLFQIPLPPLFSFVYRGGIFYMLGAYIALSGAFIPKEKTKHLALLALMCWLTILTIKTCVAFGMLPSQWLTLPQLDNMAILMGLATVWFGYDSCHTSLWSAWIYAVTPFTFFVYASHEPLLEIVKRISVDIVGRGDLSLVLVYVLTIVITLAISLTLGLVVKKLTPNVYSILTGGR